MELTPNKTESGQGIAQPESVSFLSPPAKAPRLDETLASEEKIKQAFEKKELSRKLRRTAMDLLARREHSASELADKLQTRYGFTPQIDIEIAKLTEENLQSDQRFCEAYVSSRARTGKGVVRIRHELRQKQVADVLIDKQLREADIDWFELARKVRIQKYGEAIPRDRSEWAKQARFLQYRGFDQQQVQYAFEEPAS